MTDRLTAERVWDPQLALANADDSVSDLKELLEIWLRQTPRLLSEIRRALEIEDSKKLHLAAHTLRGSLLILGAEVSCSAANDLENAGKSGQMSDCHILLTILECQIASVTAQAKTFIEQN